MDTNILLQDVKNDEDGLYKGNLQRVEAKSVVASVLGAVIDNTWPSNSLSGFCVSLSLNRNQAGWDKIFNFVSTLVLR